MTREKAIDYENQLKDKLRQTATELNLKEDIGNSLAEHYITIFCKEEKMIFDGENIRIDFKEALIAGLKSAASTASADDVFSYIQLLIASAVLTGCAADGEYDLPEAYVVYCLHTKEAYDKGIREEQFVREMRSWYRRKEDKVPNGDSIMRAVGNLNAMKIVDIEDGKLYLKKHLWGKVM
ncbi:MAG: hypothetical protein ACI4AA_02275 [Lachnospiraceae bacterium]